MLSEGWLRPADANDIRVEPCTQYCPHQPHVVVVDIVSAPVLRAPAPAPALWEEASIYEDVR
jgi:hypothetical protein